MNQKLVVSKIVDEMLDAWQLGNSPHGLVAVGGVHDGVSRESLTHH